MKMTFWEIRDWNFKNDSSKAILWFRSHERPETQIFILDLIASPTRQSLWHSHFVKESMSNAQCWPLHLVWPLKNRVLIDIGVFWKLYSYVLFLSQKGKSQLFIFTVLHYLYLNTKFSAPFCSKLFFEIQPVWGTTVGASKHILITNILDIGSEKVKITS